MKKQKKTANKQKKNATVNRNYKDTLFFFVFGREENKPYLLELYNALRTPDAPPITNINELELNTIENIIYLGRRNDVSFLIDSEMNLYEHQSTYNPNMPLRGVIYWALLMQKWLETQQKESALYQRTLIKIPTPQHVVFYNGTEKRPVTEKLHLSDAFIKPMPDYEWTTMVYNINPGNNEILLAHCQPLKEYAEFTGNVRHNLDHGMTLESSVDAACHLASKGKCLGPFFRQHRMEVTDMFLTEFDEKKYREYIREEARKEGLTEGRAEGLAEGLAEGRKEGHEKGKLNTLIELLKDGLLSIDEVAARMEMSVEDFQELANGKHE